MAQPTLSAACFPKLKKTGTSNGTVTGTIFTTDDSVSIVIKNNVKKKWSGKVGTKVKDDIWNASVSYTPRDNDLERTDETVSVVVTNSANESSSPPVDIQSDVSLT